MKQQTRRIVVAAVVAAAYVVLTWPLAQFSFGPVQFRLAEALTVLAALTPAAVPGLFIGCLLANLLNPMNLGPVDILGGSLATLLAAWLTWTMSRRLTARTDLSKSAQMLRRTIVLSPSVWVNALVVGFYLPWIIPDLQPTTAIILSTMLSIGLSQAVVVYLLGLPLLLAMERFTPSLQEHMP